MANVNFSAIGLRSLDYTKQTAEKNQMGVLAKDGKGNYYELVSKNKEIKENIFSLVHIGTKIDIEGEILGTNIHKGWAEKQITIVVNVKEMKCIANLRKVGS